MFVYMCHRAAGAVWISERCRTGQRWWGSEVTHFPLIKRRWEWMWADRRREDGTRRGGSATRPAAQKKKKRGSAVCGGRGQEHKDAPVEAFNDCNTSSDSSSESDGENRFFEELHFNFRKKTSSSANKSSYM